MGFLDNSGDIILDAVLTDIGRKKMADGNFRIVKFALGDDEIDYENYNGTDLRGSAFYDLEILQTPVLEAFTNNTSSMRSKLITITRTNILYLPTMLLNQTGRAGSGGGIPLTDSGTPLGAGVIIAATDESTADNLNKTSGLDLTYMDASAPGSSNNPIELDQGLNTTSISPSTSIPTDLYESQYQIQMDNRLISLTDDSGTIPTPSFVDDDSVASYSVSSADFITDISGEVAPSQSPIAGPRGSRLQFQLNSSLDLQSSTYLFTTLGGEVNDSVATPNKRTYYFIDTTVRVTGLTTGNSIDIPVRLLKFKSKT